MAKKKQCNFKFEENVDSLLAYLKQTHPEIRLHSAEAEKRLKEKRTSCSKEKSKGSDKRSTGEYCRIRELYAVSE